MTWRDKPPTEKQIDALRRLGHTGAVTSRGEASDLIGTLISDDDDRQEFEDHDWGWSYND
jgi:hypothetical protein